MELGYSNGSYKRMHRSFTATREERELDNKPNDSRKGASFIKLLGPDFSKQLQIPHDFTTMIFNGYIPRRFIIESDIIKKCWRVEVEEEGDGTMYLREGWSDFVEAHSLQVGYYLLFEHEEEPIFYVKIYDKNGCQKQFEDARGGTHKRVNVIDFQEQEESERSEYEPNKRITSRTNQQKTRRLSTMKHGNRTRKTKQAKYTRTAKVSLLGNNIGFSVKVHKYKTHQFYSLTFPKAISLEQNLTRKDEVVVENAKGDRWLVKLSHRKDGRAILSHGWKEFFKNNEIAAGDTLKFEFVSDGVIQVRVTKESQLEQEYEETNARNGDDNVHDMDCEVDEFDTRTVNVDPNETSIGTKKGRKRGSAELSGSSFSFLWRPTTSGVYLHVPKIVTESHNLMNEDKVTLRDQDGKCWPLEVSRWRDGRMAFMKGWIEFWKGHDVKPGDTLRFNFVSEYLIQVDITRGKPLDSVNNNINEDIVSLSISDDDDEPTTQPETILT
ncbi:hypothetical protein RND81_06G182800 [Saponaria officinalis]|uniref:TF-B3 domain-containing protein n=1 Tax=Saponaria officinalis TaxID=3572 RepID=A0AAW1KD34_SAPOF